MLKKVYAVKFGYSDQPDGNFYADDVLRVYEEQEKAEKFCAYFNNCANIIETIYIGLDNMLEKLPEDQKGSFKRMYFSSFEFGKNFPMSKLREEYSDAETYNIPYRYQSACIEETRMYVETDLDEVSPELEPPPEKSGLFSDGIF